MHDTKALEAVVDGISAIRLQGYLDEVNGDVARAVDLYTWNARMAAEVFALIGHVEVLLRNKIDNALKRAYAESERGIPWFFQIGVPGISELENSIREVRCRNRDHNYPDSRDRVIAGVTLGFWVKLLANHDLWSGKIEHAFPPGTKRKEVTGLVERIRQSRNRVAHQDYVKAFDLPRSMRDVFKLAKLLSPPYADWMDQGSDWEEIYRSSPTVDTDTVIVAGREAWEVYNAASVYVCRPGRYFRDVKYLGFYENRSIRRQIPRIKAIRDDVLWTENEAQKLEVGDEIDQKIAKAIRWSQSDGAKAIGGGWNGWGHRFKVFVLTSPRESPEGNDQHLLLPADVPHRTGGRGSAFTQRQRYTSSSRLQVADTTSDLCND